MRSVSYSKELAIVSLGMTPFYRVGPEQWFDNFSIVSLYNWDVTDQGAPQVFALRDITPGLELKPLNTQSMVRTDEFSRIVTENNLQDHNFITYRPVDLGFGSSIGDDNKVYTRTYENKQWLRERYGEELPFPVYREETLEDLMADPDGAHARLSSELESHKLVVQHEKLTGGRGTFLAADSAGFAQALQTLAANKKVKPEHRIIVSREVSNPREVSMQACVTQHGVFVGPVQSQFVRHPLLVDIANPDADKFCGGLIDNSMISEENRSRAAQVVEKLANDMKNEGYKGIFGVDFLLDAFNELYILEVNARMTGMLPLLTRLQSEKPFLLMHILESIGAEYSLQDGEDEGVSGAYVLMHAAKDGVVPDGVMKSGTYSSEGEFTSEKIGPGDGFVLHNYTLPGQKIAAGTRLGAVFFAPDSENEELAGLDVTFVEKFLESSDQLP